LQQVQNPMGTMQERTIIDGQQRLTTLQLLFDSLHAQAGGGRGSRASDAARNVGLECGAIL